MHEAASWQGTGAIAPPLNFSLSEKFRIVGKFSFKNTKVLKYLIWGEVRRRNWNFEHQYPLAQICNVCRKIATFCPA